MAEQLWKARESRGSSPWQAALQSDATLPSLCRDWLSSKGGFLKIDHASETTSDLKCHVSPFPC